MGLITGYWRQHHLEAARPDTITQMLNSAPHRSENTTHISFGSEVRLGAGFGKKASKSDFQAFDEASGVGIVLDGAIFENRDAHKMKRTNDDAKMILNMYLRYREDFLSRIDGSFCLALFDSSRKKLLLARDRLGTKPLYYCSNEKAVCFGTEIKTLLAYGLQQLQVNLTAVDSFLSYGYVPCPLTMFKQIRQVMPGQMVVFDSHQIENKTYWKFSYNPVRRKDSIDDLASEFAEIFERSVKKRLVKFPDAGAFLSGGLDTSSVVAAMRHIVGTPFKVFTAGFTEEAFNEIEDARIVANHLDVDFITTIISYEDAFADFLKNIVWLYDSPFADTSAIPSYYAAKLAKEHVNTVLTGDFPDQLIGGSGHQAKALFRERHDSVFLKALRGLGAFNLLHMIPMKAGDTHFFDKVKRSIYRESYSLEIQRILSNMPIPPLLKRCLYSKDLLESNAHLDPFFIANDLYREVRGECLLDKILYFDTLSYAPDDLMVKVERMTAAHGLNAFSPFHDRELVEFVASLPPAAKMRENERKIIMRRAFKAILPAHTMNKRKQGFAMPIGEWLLTKIPEFVKGVLLDQHALRRGYFEEKFVVKMVHNFLSGKSDYASGSEGAIISLLTLELWHQLFVDPQ